MGLKQARIREPLRHFTSVAVQIKEKTLKTAEVTSDILERACPVPILVLVLGMLCAPSGNLLIGRLTFRVR